MDHGNGLIGIAQRGNAAISSERGWRGVNALGMLNSLSVVD
jgi:hypothetical protein